MFVFVFVLACVLLLVPRVARHEQIGTQTQRVAVIEASKQTGSPESLLDSTQPKSIVLVRRAEARVHL